MRRRDSVLSAGAVQGYFLLLFACGAALLLTIPSGARVAQLLDVQWRPSPLIFHITCLTLLALLGTFRGIAAATWERPAWRTLYGLAGHVLLGQLLLLPYLFFARALFPGKEHVLPLFVIYSSLVSFMLGSIALRLDLWGRARNVHTFMLQYALFALFFLVPWSLGFVPGMPLLVTLVSPLGATLYILGSPSTAGLLVALAFVLLLTLAQVPGIRRLIRRSHAV